MDSNCYSNTTSAGKDSLSIEEQENLIKEAFERLKNGETEMKLNEQVKEYVIVYGDTGHGKSKLIQLLSGNLTRLISRETEEGTGEYLIEDTNEPDLSMLDSVTTYPEMVHDHESNVWYCDPPGLNDTRKPSYEVSATYFIKRVLDHSDRVKLVFVINYPSVRQGVYRDNFMNLLKNAAAFIRNIEKYRNSIALIISKVDNNYIKKGTQFILVDDQKVIETVAKFLTGVKKELEDKLQSGSSTDRHFHEIAVNLINILLTRNRDQYERLGLFRRPDQAGPISEISLLMENREMIKSLIDKSLRFCDTIPEDFGYTVSEKCKNSIYYLVDALNGNVWSSLCRIKEQIKEFYNQNLQVLRSIVHSIVDETSSNVDLNKAKGLSNQIKNGNHVILQLVNDVTSVTNPEDLAQQIKACISSLNIDQSINIEDDLRNIEMKGRYFNFLQVVSDRELSIRPWHEVFRNVVAHLSNAKGIIQEDIDGVVSLICDKIESNFQKIAKTLQDKMEENMKLLDLKEAEKIVSNYRHIMTKVIERATTTKSVEELLLMVRREMDFSIPDEIVISTVEQEKIFLFLKDISENELHLDSSTWVQPFQKVFKHLKEAKIWYIFLDSLYSKFSEYQIQANQEEYNVLNIEDWGETGKPQGINITRSNFAQFWEKIARYNIVKHSNVANIALTEFRLNELNQLLNLTLKSRLDIQCESASVFIRADSIRIGEVIAVLKENLVNNQPLLTALKSGEYKSLHIFALKTVFIDADLFLPGCELTIISPEWEIIGTRKISLDGADGEDHSEIKARDGEDGKPGLPGKPGGIFLGIGEWFTNGASLTVTANGGRGGPGQQGGNGRQGDDGVSVGQLTTGDIQGVQEGNIRGFRCSIREQWSGFNPIFLLLQNLGLLNAENVVYCIHGTSGTAGGNGGNGGKGGKGGNPGIVKIFHLRKKSKINGRARMGGDGLIGEGGREGAGGHNGKNTIALLNGILLNEWKYQTQESTGCASSGERGLPGLNLEGLLDPEPSKDLVESSKIINKYRTYLKDNLVSRFKKVLLLRFIDALYNDGGIKILCH